uniref:ATP synthase complex subunit 8 n=1 Tax=Chalcophana sp. N69 TaxID=2653421 RepID=A0A5Q0U0L7_9CUCU|nr:ATP synthase F0 subunit 8 [Chalcophana sp. N69]
MPQMAPLSWTLLSMMFFIIMFMFMTKIFFMKNYKPSKKQINKKETLTNWKW